MPRYSSNPPHVVIPYTPEGYEDANKSDWSGAKFCPDYEPGDGLDFGWQYAMPVKNPCKNRELHEKKEARQKCWCLRCMAGFPIVSV